MWGWLTSVEVLPKFGLDRIMGSVKGVFKRAKMAYYIEVKRAISLASFNMDVYQKGNSAGGD